MKNLFYLLLLIPMLVFSQSSVTTGVMQDARLALVGDNNGNEAYTADLVFRVLFEGNQREFGHWDGGLEYEHADLKGGAYNRFSLNFGYTFNQFVIFNNDKFVATALLNYGMTVRSLQRRDVINGVVINDRTINPTFTGFAGSLSLSYPIGDTGLSAIIMLQGSHRVDKNTLYGDDAEYTIPFLHVDGSGFAGITYTFGLPPTR